MTLTEIAGDAPFESFYLNQSSTLRGLRGLHNAMQVLQAGFKAVRRSCYGSTRRAAASLNKA
jgi:hypothetical protein